MKGYLILKDFVQAFELALLVDFVEVSLCQFVLATDISPRAQKALCCRRA